MGAHNIQDKLERAQFTSAFSGKESPEGITEGFGTTVGNGVEGWAPGAIFADTDASAGAQVFINEGTKTTASWVEVADSGVQGGFSLTGSIAATSAGSLDLADSADVTFGTGSDVEMKYDGTNNHLTMGPASGFWSGCPMVNWPGGHANAFEFFDDFNSLNVGAATSTWTLGTNTNGTIALGEAEKANTPGAGGYVTFAVDGTAQYDYCTLKATSTAAGTMCRVVENSGQKLWFEVNLTVGVVVDCYFMVGLMAPGSDDCTVDATGAENVADGFYFRTLLATETQLDTATNQNTTETEIGGNIGTIAANGNYTFGIYFDGVTTLSFYLDGTLLTDAVTIGAAGNIPNDVGLTPVIHAKDGTSGGTADDLIHVDWVKLVQIR